MALLKPGIVGEAGDAGFCAEPSIWAMAGLFIIKRMRLSGVIEFWLLPDACVWVDFVANAGLSLGALALTLIEKGELSPWGIREPNNWAVMGSTWPGMGMLVIEVFYAAYFGVKKFFFVGFEGFKAYESGGSEVYEGGPRDALGNGALKTDGNGKAACHP
jgi:hypothetical protein